jgi:H+-transporting ATPase
MTDTNSAIGLTQKDADILIKQYGYNEVPDKKMHSLLKFLSKFWGITPCMLEVIVVLSWFLHNRSDAYIVLGLLVLNAVLSFIPEQNAANAVAALRKKLQINVKLLRDSAWKTLPARELVPGDIIRVRIGDFVPADMKITEGSISVDQSALTGESAEIEKKISEGVYSGSIVTKGEATGIVTLTGLKTYFGKTVELVKTAKPKSHIDEIITKVGKLLVIVVVALLAVALAVSVIKGINILQILPLMLVLSLGAIPVALSVMFTVSMAIGSKQLVKQGVLVTRLSAPDDAASMDVLCVDKTGTLTLNKLTVAKLLPSGIYTEDKVLLYAALASQEANHDALDMAVINAAREKKLLTPSFVQKSFIPFDPKNRETEAVIINGSEEFTVTKGSFDTIEAACGLDQNTIMGWQGQIDKLAKAGYRAIAISQTKNGDKAELVGVVALHDPPRPDSLKIIADLKDLGISIKMLTGDALPIAQEIAKALNIGDKILNASAFKDALAADPKKALTLLENNNGFAGVYPEDKFNIVKALQDNGHIVGMTGDGVNDSPPLKQAEVGIAVSNAADVAKAAASIVLTTEGLSNIPAPIIIGRMMFERINIWILNKITRTISKTCFVVFAFLIFGKFIITATGMLIIIFMTDFVKISLATDNVTISKRPAKWDINSQTKTGVILGLIMAVECFGILCIGLYGFNMNADAAALGTFSFEILLFFAVASLFILREKRHFWNSRPSMTLFLFLIGDMILTVVLSSFGWLGFKAIPIIQTLTVIAYTFFCSFTLNDIVKYALLKKARLAAS